MHQRQETFVDGARPTLLSQTDNQTSDRQLRVSNVFQLKKPVYLRSETTFKHNWQRGSGHTTFVERNDLDTVWVITRSINQNWYWSLTQNLSGAFNINKRAQWSAGYSAYFRHSDSRAYPSAQYHTWQSASTARLITHNAQAVSNRTTIFMIDANVQFPKVWHNLDVRLKESLQNNYICDHDYLYHPDTLTLALQLDMLTATADANNSYKSRRMISINTVSLNIAKQSRYKTGNAAFKVVYDQWNVGLDVTTHHRTLNYQQGSIDTTLRHSVTYLSPSIAYRYMSDKGTNDLRINALQPATH